MSVLSKQMNLIWTSVHMIIPSIEYVSILEQTILLIFGISRSVVLATSYPFVKKNGSWITRTRRPQEELRKQWKGLPRRELAPWALQALADEFDRSKVASTWGWWQSLTHNFCS